MGNVRRRNEAMTALVRLDMFANVLLAGSHEHTISGRIGHYSAGRFGLWKVAEKVVDWAFSPIEENHCERQRSNEDYSDYHNDADLTFEEGGRLPLLVLVAGCCLLAPVIFLVCSSIAKRRGV